MVQSGKYNIRSDFCEQILFIMHELAWHKIKNIEQGRAGEILEVELFSVINALL